MASRDARRRVARALQADRDSGDWNTMLRLGAESEAW